MIRGNYYQLTIYPILPTHLCPRPTPGSVPIPPLCVEVHHCVFRLSHLPRMSLVVLPIFKEACQCLSSDLCLYVHIELTRR